MANNGLFPPRLQLPSDEKEKITLACSIFSEAESALEDLQHGLVFGKEAIGVIKSRLERIRRILPNIASTLDETEKVVNKYLDRNSCNNYQKGP